MRRREFIAKGITGTVAIGTAGCSGFGRKINLINTQEIAMAPEDYFKATVPKPSGGSMPMGEVGTTGIKVSKFTFGSHMSGKLTKYEKEREFMLREAFDLGVTIFDVYELSWRIYQYEPTGRYLKPIINDVVISIDLLPYDGRTIQQELERTLKLFNRDYIDLVRAQHSAMDWDSLLKFKEQGKIRALGYPIHLPKELETTIREYPVDYVVIPYNFYHNMLWDGRNPGDFDPLLKEARDKGIGVIVMKPMASDNFVRSLKSAAKQVDETGEISFPQAALRYVLNSELNPDTIFNGMWNVNHVYENIPAFYHSSISAEEEALLDKLRKVTKVAANTWSSDYYKFLEQWAPDSCDDSNVTDMV